MNDIKEKIEAGVKLTRDEARIMNKFSSEYGSIMIESSLDSEHFINRLVNRNASLAEKVVYKIEQMKEALRSRTDERAMAERKRLIKAENLYLKAARAAGNHRLENYILSRISEEDEKEVDSEAERIKYSYAGEKAKNADRLKLSTAEQMLESGVDAETVRKETGWFKGYDGKWRFEIDDSEFEVAFNGKFSRNPKIKRYAELVEKVYFLDTATQQEQEELSLLDKKIGNKSIVPDKLGDLIKHPTLFEAYPELADIDIYFNETEKTASYHPGFKEISIPKSLKRDIENFKRTLMHEIQHAIQDIEGFAGGSNPDMFNDTEKQSAFEQYRNTAGEIEARDVANRANMTAEQRKNTRSDIDRTDAVNIESEYAESVDTTDKGVPVVVVNDDITRYAHNDKTLVKLVKASIGKMPYVALGRQKIKFLKDTKGEVTYSKYTQWLRRNMPNVYKDKMRLFGHPSEIIIATTNYVNEAPKHPRNDDIVDFARGEVLIDISGRKYKAEVIIGFTNKGECELHNVENLTPTTFEYKKRDALSTISHSGEHLQKRSSLGNSISDSEQKINPSDENFSKNFSNDGKTGENEAKKGEIIGNMSRKSSDNKKTAVTNINDENMHVTGENNNDFAGFDNTNDTNKKIKAGMSEEERYEILKNRHLVNVKSISALSSELKKKIPELSSWEDVNKYLGSEKRRIIKNLANEFGAIQKEYFNEDVALSFYFSINNFEETYKKQEKNFEQFAKMFSVFNSVVESAVGVEVHNRTDYKFDATLDNMFVLVSAYQDGDYIVPVKLEIKKFKDKQNTLYVAVALNKIKKTEVWKQGNTINGVTQNSRSANISIAKIFEKINPSDEFLGKFK